MNYSEKMLEELIRLSVENGTGLFEAASDYCESQDIEQSEFIETLDPYVIQRLKEDAVRERKVRQCVQKPTETLF